jgi:oligopeptide transport system substrate-binding protein
MNAKNSMSHLLYLPLLLLLTALIFWGCQKKRSQDPLHKRTLKTCLITQPSTIDTRKNADVFSSTVQFLIYEGLTRILPSGEAELALAKSVDVSEDGCTYTFYLREAYWTDGHPITAYDFEYSWKKILDPDFGSPCCQIFFPIKNGEKCIKKLASSDSIGIKAVDASTLQIELEHPTPYFLSLVTFCNFYPIPKHVEMKDPNWFHAPEKNSVSSGPFFIKKWIHNKEILLVKNPTYWDAKNVALEAVHFSIIPDGRTALQMFENKELDFISTVTSPLLSEDLAEMRRKKLLRITPVGGLLFCTFNLEKHPMNNLSIRKALSYAIDRITLVQSISQLSEEPATRCVAPIMMPQKKRDLFPPFDPELARDLFRKGLKELGVDPSHLSPFVLSYPNQEPYKKIAETIQQQWKMVLGIEVVIEERDHKSHLSNIMNKDYCVALYNCIAQHIDPTSVLDRFKYKNGQKNYPGFQNEEYIQLLDKASMRKNPQERMDLLSEAEELLMSQMPISPIYHFNQGVLISPHFTNVEFSPLSNLLFKKIKPAEEM